MIIRANISGVRCTFFSFLLLYDHKIAAATPSIMPMLKEGRMDIGWAKVSTPVILLVKGRKKEREERILMWVTKARKRFMAEVEHKLDYKITKVTISIKE